MRSRKSKDRYISHFTPTHFTSYISQRCIGVLKYKSLRNSESFANYHTFHISHLTFQKMPPFDKTNPDIVKFIKAFDNYFVQKFFLLIKLPSALFMGVKVIELSPEKARVSVPYKWRSQNPFKSIYFAAQASAAEMSTGLLAMMALQGRGNVSMLITGMEGTFVKKGTSKTVFTCTESYKIFDAVKKAIETGEPQVVSVETVGIQESGEVVSKFTFTWSFKAKGQ